ncbi:MAG: hypothetical protein WBA97_24015 [Actinophytocola sp.]|uniref:AbiTii domain-containing protein n=1 Tax=Actinophytocola sp. TaxID=1872138 RepID=UPI003C779AE0
MSAGLLAQIEAGVLEGEPLPSLLQKCLVLGGRAGSEKMRDWARQELNGYPGIGGLPPYRMLHAQVKLTLTNPWGYQPKTTSFSTAQLPDQLSTFLKEKGTVLESIPMNMGVGELDAMADSGKGEHHLLPWWSDMLLPVLNEHYVDQEYTRVQDVYWALSNSTLKGLLVQIRTNLAELVGELLALTPDDRQPTKEAADAVTVFILSGDRNVITNLRQDVTGGTAVATQGGESPVTAAGTGGTAIGSQTASSEGASVVGSQVASGDGSRATGRDSTQAEPVTSKDGFFKRFRKRGMYVGIATILAAVVGVLQLLGWTPW